MAEEATFAAGCFWGVEASFRKLRGVIDTSVGYAGGHTENPSYEQVCTGKTGHAESVRVLFDTQLITYADLLDVFWKMHDPCSRDRQGPDVGSQYRSAIFYHDEVQRDEAFASRDRLDKGGVCGAKGVVTEIVPLSCFYVAEEYHQRYHEKHRLFGRLCSG
ncbi:MAG: peptide-methionine (S)-S-oxide reductase MsrA [Methanobacteriota archaeon]|nr:MAG: peptide-methionine (S)-S-oxide reductase MsrA [Euryarchaeota archaeon]